MNARYRFRAVARSGRLEKGVLAAPSAREAESLLAHRGLQPIAIELEQNAPNRPPASAQELAILFRSLASLRAAGMPLDQVLRSTLPLASVGLRDSLEQARASLSSGRTLADALGEGESRIPHLIIGMVRAGERTGQLDAALAQAADHLEHQAEFQARLRQALSYPVMLTVAGLLSLGVIVGIVVPRFAVLLGEFGQELPPITRILMAASAFLQHWALFLAALLAGALAALRIRIRSPEGRCAFDRILLRSPIVGSINHALVGARFLRAFSAALSSGVPILPALEAATETTGRGEIASRLVQGRERVTEGKSVSEALRNVDALPALALELLAIGEGSGQLGAMALRASTLLAADAERRLATAVRLLEPALVVVFGGLVALVAGALLQAVYSLRPVS